MFFSCPGRRRAYNSAAVRILGQHPCSGASKALGFGAASFARESETGFGDGDEVTELVEVPKSYFDFWSETVTWRAKI